MLLLLYFSLRLKRMHSTINDTRLYLSVSVAMNPVRRNNRYADATLKRLDWTRKSASAFLHGRALVNPEIESMRARARGCMCVCVYFFILGLSPGLSPSPLLASVTAVERDRDALFPPPSRSFHLFRSRHCMPRGDELSLSTFSIYLPPTASLFLPACLSVTLALHGRSEQWTNRLDVISTYPRIHV